MRSYWLFAALVFSALLAGVHLIALQDFLYWRYVWFDIPMHILGGLAIATFIIGFLHTRKTGLFLVLFLLAIVGWEVFEYVFGIPRDANYPLDTAIDLVMDIVGGGITYLVARKTLWR